MAGFALLKKASLVGAFFVFGFFIGPAWAFCPVPGKLEQVGVLRVVDGDTLRLSDGRSVRLIGLNTPELAHHGRSAEPFGEAARRRLVELVAANDGRVGVVLGRESRDRYGRTLAYLYGAEGQSIEAQLLAEGLGFLVAVAPNVALLDCLRAAERSARQARLGLWRGSPVRTPEQLDAAGFALIQARIERVEGNRGGLWLELGETLVLHVAPALRERFEARHGRELLGRRVEARGWVIDRARRGGVQPGKARWMLPLTHAAMLEVLP
ncbi:thermonuclease family protein [Pseudomonas zhanjiangensis]|uniref:Thermonuclease family protein n=1 Tax=Pseudomonas zhanjiangensis TaxID=3239015 RepID=A0ABV3YXN6_9PSED